MPATARILYGMPLSGHTHRVVLLLEALGLPYDFVSAPPAFRATAEFRALNPLGKIPVLVDGSAVIPDSNAILVYLARRYDREGSWLPADPLEAAAVQRWLSIAAGELMYGPATARMVTLWGMEGDVDRARAIAARLLPMMDDHLSSRDWLAVPHPTIADLACYSYVARAPEGRLSLDAYPAIQSWLQRVEALPSFRHIEHTEIPKGAP